MKKLVVLLGLFTMACFGQYANGQKVTKDGVTLTFYDQPGKVLGYDKTVTVCVDSTDPNVFGFKITMKVRIGEWAFIDIPVLARPLPSAPWFPRTACTNRYDALAEDIIWIAVEELRPSPAIEF